METRHLAKIYDKQKLITSNGMEYGVIYSLVSCLSTPLTSSGGYRNHRGPGWGSVYM